MVRPPAVAGRFYPGNPRTLAKTVQDLLAPAANPIRAIGIVVPHAGYIYSGRVAGAVYSRVQMSTRAIILCPNHTGLGAPLAIMRQGAWQTPLGDLQIDTDLCDALMEANCGLEEDMAAHRLEHSLEVQLPFLQSLGHTSGFAPIAVGTAEWRRLEMLGQAIARVIARLDPSTLIIASSDMNHYESDDVTRIKDAKAIEPMLQLDAKGLYETVRRENISMCGFGPASAMIIAARQLGATRAELTSYATSAEVSNDFEHVVGYAGIVVN